jgi:hypothetical protein
MRHYKAFFSGRFYWEFFKVSFLLRSERIIDFFFQGRLSPLLRLLGVVKEKDEKPKISTV